MEELKGGSYVVENGERKRVEGTADHPEGNRARDAQGRVLGFDGKPIEAGAEAVEPAVQTSAPPAPDASASRGFSRGEE